MYPFLRLRRVLAEARRREPLPIDGVSVITLRCWPWDIDMFNELNNGRAMTLYDLGRFDLAVRCGLSKALKERKWGLAVAGGSIRFRKRVRVFDRIEMRSQAVGRDARWVYIAQSMWVAGAPASASLLRTCVTSSDGIVPTDKIAEAFGVAWRVDAPDWAQAWIAADEQRPWPPVP